MIVDLSQEVYIITNDSKIVKVVKIDLLNQVVYSIDGLAYNLKDIKLANSLS